MFTPQKRHEGNKGRYGRNHDSSYGYELNSKPNACNKDILSISM